MYKSVATLSEHPEPRFISTSPVWDVLVSRLHLVCSPPPWYTDSAMNSGRRLSTRLALSAAFLVMGFSFSITQTLLAREMLVSFAGNELSIGLMLGSWLLLEAAGSGLLGRLVSPLTAGPHRRSGRSACRYGRLQILLALLLLPVVSLAMGARRLVGGVPGQGLGLIPISVASFLLLIPLGLIDGAMFTVGCRADEESHSEGRGWTGRVYVLEALGGLVGGVVFTYLFVPALTSVQMALILASLNLSSALWLLLPNHPAQATRNRCATLRWTVALALLLLVALGLLFSPAANALHSRLLDWRWQGYDLVFSDHSPYGNVAAARQGDQVTFFANGMPIITSPVPDLTAVEEMVHLPMLFVEQPRRALVLGGGLGGVLGELLKYPLERVDYAELDPLLIEAISKLSTPLTDAELTDPRVHIQPLDGRLVVQQLAAVPLAPGAAYDLILINLPYPTTLQLNRFYTLEFWNMAQALLNDGGVLAFPAPGSLTYLSPGLRSLHAVLYSTLSEAFAYVRPIPGEATLWLASRSEEVHTIAVETLVQRWESRRLPSGLISDFHIRLALDEASRAQFLASLASSNGGAPARVNRDFRPAGVLHGLAYWSELFSPGVTPYLRLLQRLSLPPLLVSIAVLALAGVAVLRIRHGRDAVSIPVAIGLTGFAGMTADLLIIFAFQVFYGHVYRYIGLLIAGFMAGLSLGAWMMARRGQRAKDNQGYHSDRRWLLGLELALIVFWLLLPLVLTLLHGGRTQGASQAIVTPVLLLLNGMAGFLVGAQFPLASRMLRHRKPELGERAGMVYAVDLLGAFAASLLVSVVLLPALGIVQTCLLVAALKAGSMMLVATMMR